VYAELAMMRTILLLFVSLCVCVISCTGAESEFGPHFGYVEGKISALRPALFGLHFVYNAPKVFSAELAGTRVPAQFAEGCIPDPSSATGACLAPIDADIFLASLTARARIDFPWEWQLYGGGGVTYAAVRAKPQPLIDVEFDSGGAVGYHGCLGLVRILGDRLSLFAEYRHTVADIATSWRVRVQNTPEDGGEPFTVSETEGHRSFRYDVGMVRLGLSFGL